MAELREFDNLIGVLASSGGGGGGSDDYNDLSNKPQINGFTLVGNKSSADLGLDVNAEMLSELIEGQDDIRVDLSEDEQTLIVGTHAKIVTISNVPPTAVQGTLTEEQLSALEESTNSYIVFNNELYKLNDNGHEAGTKGYSHTGVENGVFMLKNITVTLNTRGWVLTSKEVEDGGISENAYDSIENVGDIDESYLAYTEYSGLDYGYAKEFFANLDVVPNFGMCSSVIIDGQLIRNYDWKYSNNCEFVVRTPAINNRHSVVGTVGQVGDLTKDFVKNREYSEKYKVMPFFLVDGYNDAGLMMNINVVPNDKGDTTGTLADSEEINALMFIRWALDYCSTVDEVKSALENDISIVVPQIMRDMGYEVHFLMHDKTMADDEGWVLEFVNNECVWTNHNKMTNFFIDGVAFKDDGTVPVIGDADINDYGLTEHAEGLERYNIIVNHSGTGIELLESLKYTNLYTLNQYKWFSELCSGSITISSSTITFQNAMETARQQYAERSRDTALTDQSVHSVIYSDKMDIFTQENFETVYEFDLPKSSGGVTSVNEKTGDVVLSASDIKADNTQTVQENLERIDEELANKVDTDIVDSSASSTDKLIPESKINEKIEMVEANQLYKDANQGSFETKEEITNATKFYGADGNETTPTKNDVVYVLADESHDGKSAKYTVASVNPVVWAFVIVYEVTFTQAQLDALNSGMTATKLAQIIADIEGKAPMYELLAHTSNRTNPHNVSKAQLGLGNVDNTSDLNKPISSAQAAVNEELTEDIETLETEKQKNLVFDSATNTLHF